MTGIKFTEVHISTNNESVLLPVQQGGTALEVVISRYGNKPIWKHHLRLEQI